LKFISAGILEQLWEDVPLNLSRYAKGDFEDLAIGNGWAIETATVDMDTGILASLKTGATSPQLEIENSLLVHEALAGMTPALACEERIWVRLTHLECLEYSRARWLAGKEEGELEKLVKEHFFAKSRTRTRDDNAVARLWWNAHVAHLARPDDPAGSLRLILKSADIRSSFVERARTVSRPKLARALVNVMDTNPWVTSAEANFRATMKVVNRDGGGILFECLSDTRIDEFMMACADRAAAELDAS